jgi:ABC-type transport system substrate-binding protein
MKKRFAVAVLSAALLVSGAVATVTWQAASASPTAPAQITTLTVGKTYTVASNLTLQPGSPETFGPFDTNACHALDLFVDGALYDVQTGLEVAGLPGQTGPIGIVGITDAQTDTSGLAGTGELVTQEPEPGVQVIVSAGSAGDTVNNIYLYCDRTR